MLYDSAKIYLYLFASSFTISSQESMRFIKLAIEFYKNAYSDSSQNALGAYIQQYNVNMYEKILKEYLGVEKLTTELEVAVKFFCYGGLGMTREWIMINANVSAEQYSAMMHDNMPLLLKEAILNKRV